MVDLPQRKKIVAAIQDYLDGRIDNFELDDVLSSVDSKDLACQEVCLEMYRFYGDYNRHWYKDRRLKPKYEAGIYRWLMFLSTRLEWPAKPRFSGNILLRCLQIIVSIFQTNESTEFSRNPYWPLDSESAWREIGLINNKGIDVTD